MTLVEWSMRCLSLLKCGRPWVVYGAGPDERCPFCGSRQVSGR